VVPSATLRILFVMLILTHDRRKIVRFDVTQHPTAGWLSRQLTDAFPWGTAPRFLLRDRDTSYGSVFRKRVEVMGITEVVTAPRSPWQNAYVERVIGSIRRECLDHVVIFNQRHLRCSSHLMWITTTAPGPIFHWTKIVRTLDPSSRPHAARSLPSRTSVRHTTEGHAAWLEVIDIPA
jgi:transposase InsO family protein